ncbi:E3 ubiquitin-protein ligase Os04g0590900 [Linum grandiflorum]
MSSLSSLSVTSPAKTSIPFMNKNDCPPLSTCSLHCPHLCIKLIFPTSSPPPPPPPPDNHFSISTTSFSPIVIAIIGILASALLLLSYYVLISKYCHRGNSTIQDDLARRSTRSRGRRITRQNNVINDDTNGQFDTDLMNRSSRHEPWQWHVSLTTGLDQSLIKSITACKYSKDSGLVGEGTEHCSVCLSEFHEGDTLRLLPKCNHAFHLDCIDTWLTTHSTCPLCRANIFFFGSDDHPLPTPVAARQGNENEDETHAARDDTERVQISVDQGSEVNNGTGVDERNDRRQQAVRRCVSMDHLGRQTNNNRRVCVGGELRVDEDQQGEEEESKHGSCSHSRSNRKLMDNLKRSFSSGRLFYLSRQGNRAFQHPTTFSSTSNV